MTEQDEKRARMRGTSEKLLEATRKTLHNATIKAGQYKRIVQKKIDANAVQKKIVTAHHDLGKLVDDLREAGEKNILGKPEIKELFTQIDTLKQSAVTLLADIESIRNESGDSGGESAEPTDSSTGR